MQIGFIGLGKMGGLMVEALMKDGHDVVATDVNEEARTAIATKGAAVAENIAGLVEQLESPRVFWLMVPHGPIVDAVLEELKPHLSKGDIVIDGGNSYHKSTVIRGAALKELGVEYMDCGTSGGLDGARDGACLMIGGADAAFQKTEPIFKSLAMEGGYAHFGPTGSGHYVKMVHNGVEYALVQAFGEGFELLKNSHYDYDLEKVSDNWLHGSIVRAYVLEMANRAFKEDPTLEGISDEVGGGSTGEWTLEASVDAETPIPSIYAALAARYGTRRKESFAGKVVAAMRNQWGGHEVTKK